LTEQELVSHARRGENAAWAELIRLHEEAVFRLAYLHLADPAEAEDAAQECFIRAYRNLNRFDAARPLRPWLLRIVSNLALNRMRSVGRYLAALQRAAQQQPPMAVGPDAKSDEETESRELWSTVRMLPERMQTVLYLRYFLELSLDETAQALNLAEGTVKSQTHRALEKLREIIKDKVPALWEEWQ
jgi:RNA polymerase sigma-70 factor (ECF subfamily)